MRQFLRLRFSKRGDIRFTSHRDMMRLFMRVLRRTALPLAVSQGFNPRLRISLPAPLGVGIEGANEVLDLEMSRWCRPGYVSGVIGGLLPEGISLASVRILQGKPARCPEALSYSVPLCEGHPVNDAVLRKIERRGSLVVARETDKGIKKKDIGPFIMHLRLQEGRLLMLLKVTEAGTARPQEVLDVIGCRPFIHYSPARIVRTHVSLIPSL